MLLDKQKNADRFEGFADLYDAVRPRCPEYILNISRRYLGRNPEVVVDMGCGTGLSTVAWVGTASHIVGLEPGDDMLIVARARAADIAEIEFVQAFADNTGLPVNYADVVTCSQSFHWMEPQSTLTEVNRILKPGGLFLAFDCDWPLVCDWRVEKAYAELEERIAECEAGMPDVQESYSKWPKNKHLANIEKSGYFRFAREIVFATQEPCTAERFIAISKSQGGIQSLFKRHPEAIMPAWEAFERTARECLGEGNVETDFCYRLRIAVK